MKLVLLITETLNIISQKILKWKLHFDDNNSPPDSKFSIFRSTEHYFTPGGGGGSDMVKW